jgi:hypothetical protein
LLLGGKKKMENKSKDARGGRSYPIPANGVERLCNGARQAWEF